MLNTPYHTRHWVAEILVKLVLVVVQQKRNIDLGCSWNCIV